MVEELSKAYEPKEVEDKWYESWISGGYFTPDPRSKKKAYSIVIPPPNVTGVLTMGHVLNNTLQDILARRKRMENFEVLWLPGTDHAGIATQTVVERTLKKEGKIKHRDDLGREKFVEKIWEWKHKHGSIIIQQLKKLGCSCDWTREVFTMDGLDPDDPKPRINYPERVRKVFVDLYSKGYIYRGLKMVNWCPVSRTALSDEEVEMKESDGHLWHFRYPIVGEEGKYVIVATTRPETMLGDEAVAVNPKDKRYKKLIGKKVLLPLQNKEIPIIADDVVEMSFGTGAVKVTPAHDPVDHDLGQRHALPNTVVIGPDGRMTFDAGEKFEGLDRFECRKAIVCDMEEAGLLEKTEPYKHNVGYSQRADVPVEPRLSEQWFLKYPSVEKSLKAVQDGDVKFWPERWSKVYSHWMTNIRDWCVSRQLWWGHRIPAWYCENEKCGPIVAMEAPKSCPKCGSTKLVQDPDVLDTWFSSWLWPFATMGWPERTDDLKKFYPTTDLVTGPDIIFFWVARMIMAGYEFVGEKPFNNVYYTGIIRDSQGRKMSKSLGNSPDPLDLIAHYGADGLRFGLMLIAPKGQDILFSEDRIEVGRNFMNKLWNASRFSMMNFDASRETHGPEFFYNKDGSKALSLADKWILNRLQHTTAEVNQALDGYQFDTAARALYQFVWGEFCDWYLELAKTQISSSDGAVAAITQSLLFYVLNNILCLLHPFAPFITEEIWQKIGAMGALKNKEASKTIMFAKYPETSKKIEYEKEANEMQMIMEVIRSIRNIRGEHNIKPSKEIAVTLIVHDKDVESALERDKKFITSLTKIGELSIALNIKPPKDGATAVAGPVEIFVPFAGLINVEEERTRLAKEIARVEGNLARVEAKLSNENFVRNAPKEIVDKERGRIDEARAELEKLTRAMEQIK